MWAYRRLLAISMLACAVLAPVGASAQQPITADQILNALTPRAPISRSLSPQRPDSTPNPEQTAFIDSLRNKPAKAIGTDERQKLVGVAADKPSIDLTINFDYNSDKIGTAAVPVVHAVGSALTSPKLAGGTFLVAGYTDGQGADLYNQGLSERRAEAVKEYLIEHYKIPAVNLVAVGYGKTHLKNPGNPLASENRRVQLVNIMATEVAGK
jgi:outer membrane protein OmpA-like peptidoglycan-associated protein